VSVPNGEWRLALAPREGWGAGRFAGLPEAAAACLALLVAGLAYTVLRQPVLLRRQVEERTAELARANALLAESQKLDGLGRLAGGIAHDFNNLLTVVLGCAEVLREDLRAGTVRAEDVDEIRAAGERARDLTAQLLAFARRQVITPEPLDLNEVLRGTEKLLRRVLGEDVRLEPSLSAEVWPVRADRGQLEQVVLNLSVNARDAMPTGGRLAIETANVTVGAGGTAQGIPPGDWVRLTVRDTGHGMTPEVRAHLFEPFFTTKPKGQGTGLGLATVYGIVKQSGGHVDVDSAEGAGTAVHVYLPRTAATAAPARPAPPPAATRGGSETVLVVEDDPHVREFTVRALRDGGYRVLVAPGGDAALETAAAEPSPIHLLLTDVVMPGVDGRALAERLARVRPALRVLYVSGYAESVIARHGVLAPGVDLLAKPFTPAALLGKVRAVLDA
jgi:signal transduction histidine kinase/CheY-like chemotaxis protein